MAQRGLRIRPAAIGALLLVLPVAGIFIFRTVNRPVGVEELWRREYEQRDLEGKIVTVRGDIVFEPLSDFRFNSIYLVDAGTPAEYRDPAYAFWFGVRIDGISCIPDTDRELITCEPFDPGGATAFEFRGAVRLEQIGKKQIMWLSEIDFEHSRRWVDGAWQPVPLGKFAMPLTKK